MARHLKILEFALSSLMRRRYRNLAVIAVYALAVSILASVVFLTTALRREASALLRSAPDLVVQRTVAGRHDFIPPEYRFSIEDIAGVGEVKPRVWGYYYDALTESNYTVIGVEGTGGELELLDGRMPSAAGECAIGAGVAEMRRTEAGEDLILINGRGVGAAYDVVGVFSSESALLTNDLVVFSDGDARDFFGIGENAATDLSVEVFNEREVQNVARKIKRMLPDTRPITRTEIMRTYDAVFSWRSGMMLTLFSASLLAFCILAWDKATGISGEEKREMGVLKAIGWDTADVMELKFWEGAAVSVTSLLLGLIAAFIHVFFLGAPLLSRVLKGWSVVFPDFNVTPFVDGYQVAVIAFLTVVPYVVSTIVPTWKAAITDPETVMRG